SVVQVARTPTAPSPTLPARQSRCARTPVPAGPARGWSTTGRVRATAPIQAARWPCRPKDPSGQCSSSTRDTSRKAFRSTSIGSGSGPAIYNRSVGSSGTYIDGAWQYVATGASDIGVGADGSVWVVTDKPGTAGQGNGVAAMTASGVRQIAGAEAVALAVGPD